MEDMKLDSFVSVKELVLNFYQLRDFKYQILKCNYLKLYTRENVSLPSIDGKQL